MKKLFILTCFLCTLLFASAAFAAPLTTYRPGALAVGVTAKYAKLKFDSESYSRDWSVGYNFEVGLNPKVALQVNGFNDTGDEWYKPKLQTQEAKLKYQLLKNDLMFLSGYAGLARNKAKFDIGNGNHTNRKTSGLLGLTGVINLSPSNFKLYGDFGVGNKTLSGDIGLSYAVIKNIELDFGYKWYKAKDLKWADGYKADATSKGLYVGCTFKI